MPDLQSLIDEIASTLRDQEDKGSVADYIPELAKLDKEKFGMAIVTVDGGHIRLSANCVSTICRVEILSNPANDPGSDHVHQSVPRMLTPNTSLL